LILNYKGQHAENIAYMITELTLTLKFSTIEHWYFSNEVKVYTSYSIFYSVLYTVELSAPNPNPNGKIRVICREKVFRRKSIVYRIKVKMGSVGI
jgi:hypothetical protein